MTKRIISHFRNGGMIYREREIAFCVQLVKYKSYIYPRRTIYILFQTLTNFIQVYLHSEFKIHIGKFINIEL